MIGPNAENAASGAQIRSPISGMAPHDLPLVVVERPGLREDPVRDADLPDVVEEGAVGDGVELLGREPDAQRDPGRMGGEPLAVVLRRRVLGLDRVGEGGDDGMRRFHPDEGTSEAKGAADAGEQLRPVERLADEVVGAGVEAVDDVLRRAAAGQEEDREVGPCGVTAEPAGDLVPVELGQADVQEDQVGVVLADRAEARLAVGHADNCVSVALEDRLEQRAVGCVVLDHEDDGPRRARGAIGRRCAVFRVNHPKNPRGGRR